MSPTSMWLDGVVARMRGGWWVAFWPRRLSASQGPAMGSGGLNSAGTKNRRHVTSVRSVQYASRGINFRKVAHRRRTGGKVRPI